MPALEEMIAYTKQLHQLFTDQRIVVERAQLIQEIHVLLDKRAHILPHLTEPVTEEEKIQTSELLQLNEHVQIEMGNFFNLLKKEIQTSKLQRKSNRSYTNPYKDIQAADGMFVDQKN